MVSILGVVLLLSTLRDAGESTLQLWSTDWVVDAHGIRSVVFLDDERWYADVLFDEDLEPRESPDTAFGGTLRLVGRRGQETNDAIAGILVFSPLRARCHNIGNLSRSTLTWSEEGRRLTGTLVFEATPCWSQPDSAPIEIAVEVDATLKKVRRCPSEELIPNRRADLEDWCER